MTPLYIWCGIIICHIVPVICTIGDVKDIHTKLFVTEAYNKKIRPRLNQTEKIDVSVNFHLKAINTLDEVNEVLKTTAFLSIIWDDDFLQWDPSMYGGTTQILLPQDDIWKPDVTLENSYKDFKELGMTSLNVAVTYHGRVTWFPFQVYESTCSIDIRNFPFDVQTCSLRFVAWSYSVREVNMFSDNDGFFLDEYEANSAWDIIDTNWDYSETLDSDIHFTLTMKRKPHFFLVSVILPITLLSLLNIFVFALPCESGERSGFAITVFLALAVFLTIVSTTLPANSDTIAIFSIYLIIQTVQSTMITLIAVLMIRLHSFADDTPIPICIACILRAKNILTCKKRRSSNKIMASSEDGNSADNHIDIVSVCTTQPNETINHNNEPANDAQPTYTWKDVLNLLDIVFLIFFTLVLFISTTVCFAMSTTR